MVPPKTELIKRYIRILDIGVYIDKSFENIIPVLKVSLIIYNITYGSLLESFRSVFDLVTFKLLYFTSHRNWIITQSFKTRFRENDYKNN